jgi:hypothetical protein
MLKSFGRSIWHFFVRPAPTSVALMVGPMPNAANDDQAQLLRRAMRAASLPEEMSPAFDTTVAEPKLTVVSAAPVEQVEAARQAEAEETPASDDEAAECAHDTMIFEDDPEGGINDQTDDAALALMSEAEPAADAEKMDSADQALADDVPEPEEQLHAADGTAEEDEQPEELETEASADGLSANGDTPEVFEPEELDAATNEDDEDDAGRGGAVFTEVADETGLPEAPIAEVPKRVAQAPYVAALAELGDALSNLKIELAPADGGISETEAEGTPFVAMRDEMSESAIEQGETSEEIIEAAEEDSLAFDEAALPEEPAETVFAEPAAEVESAAEEPEEDAPAKKARKKRASSPRKKKSSTKSSSRKSKAKDEARAEPVPEDDVWVSDAVVWSLSGEWIDGEWHAPEDLDCPQRLEELRELAAEGKLTIWGRSDDAAVWQPIEASYWKSGTVEPASLAEGRENVVAEPKAPGKAKSKRKSARKYSALKVSKSQIEEIWQPSAMH